MSPRGGFVRLFDLYSIGEKRKDKIPVSKVVPLAGQATCHNTAFSGKIRRTAGQKSTASSLSCSQRGAVTQLKNQSKLLSRRLTLCDS